MRHKIAIVRGANLNGWEMQNYEHLSSVFDITAYTTIGHNYNVKEIKLPVVHLPSQSQGLLSHMEGLEEHLADKEIIFTADISYLFSAQAIHAKMKYGNKVICLEWENIPFNHEGNEIVGKVKDLVRNNADHFIAVTERAKEALMLEGIPEEMIDVVPMGVDLSRFKPGISEMIREREQLGIRNEEIVVLFIGRMVWEKGIYDLVHAASKIMSDNELKKYRIRFIITGNGPELKHVRERVCKLGLLNWTMFLDNYPYGDIHRLHNLADIFVLPSIPTVNWQEQYGMVLIESMACGKPVISTLSGSIPEVIGDAGILIQPNDHLSLYQSIKKLILDNQLRENIGEEALIRARNEFDSRKNAEKMKKVFEKVLSSRTVQKIVGDVYKRALKCWEEGSKEKGFQLVKKAFDEDPDNKEILDSLVTMGRDIKKLERVEDNLREYLCYHPAHIDAIITLAETLFDMGRDDQAYEELKKVLIFEPENKRAIELLSISK